VTNYRRALAFHVRIGDRPPRAPIVPDADTLALRLRLLEEEGREAREALQALADLARTDASSAETPSPTRVAAQAAAAHELADLLYVAYGTFVALGVDADEVFAEVHAANVRKAGAPRRADGKQLKPEGWRPADVAGVLERQRRDDGQGRAMDTL
jgi:predicted HAD superfamily Cof-like phosphohydrolase